MVTSNILKDLESKRFLISKQYVQSICSKAFYVFQSNLKVIFTDSYPTPTILLIILLLKFSYLENKKYKMFIMLHLSENHKMFW